MNEVSARSARVARVVALAALGVLAPRAVSAQPAAPPTAPGPPPPAAPAPAPAPTPPPPDGPIVPVDESEPPPSPRQPFKDDLTTPGEVGRPDPADAIRWEDDWPRFRTWQYVLTGVQGVAAFASTAIPAGGGRVPLRNGFDDDARQALRAETYDGYLLARDVSDVGLVLLINHRVADSLFVTWWGYDKGSVAWQMAMIDIQTVSFTAAVNGIVAGVMARQRPYADRNCESDTEPPIAECTGSRRYRSFFSGHSSTAWTLAGLTCMHHANIPLYGHPIADGAACVGAVGAAGTVAMMRVVADQHWVSDVMVGSAFGLASGLAIPWMFHYSGGATPASSGPDPVKGGRETRPSVAFTVAPTPGGASIQGVF